MTTRRIAEAAEVGRATLFAYYPTKEALVLDRVDEDDPCLAVAARAPGVTLVDALRAGRPPALDGQEGRKAVALVRAIYASAESGRPIRIS